MPDESAAAPDRSEVERWLPHRPPFLYVDRVAEYREDGLTGELLVRDDEPFVAGHYPGNPVMPGVLILECLFQAGALFLSRRLHEQRSAAGDTAAEAPPAGVPVITRISGARFRKMVRPGDRLQLEVTLDDHAANAFRLRGKASVGGRLAASVEFTCALIDEADAAG